MCNLAKKEKETLNTCFKSNKHKKEAKWTYLCLFILPERLALSVCLVIISKKNVKLCSLSKKKIEETDELTFLVRLGPFVQLCPFIQTPFLKKGKRNVLEQI